jgi:hypothetical protein
MLLDLGGNLLFSVHGGGDAINGIIDLLGHFLTRVEHLASLSPRNIARGCSIAKSASAICAFSNCFVNTVFCD